jgi:hypothetical protein
LSKSPVIQREEFSMKVWVTNRGFSRAKVEERRQRRSGPPGDQNLAQGFARKAAEVSAVPTVRMRRGEPVAAAKAIATPRDRREAPAVGVRRVDSGIAKAIPVHEDAGGGDLDQVSWKGGEDLEDGCRVPGTEAGREIGAGTAEPGGIEGETGGDESASRQRQGHRTIEAAGERRREVHAHKPPADGAQEISGGEEGQRRKKETNGAADPLRKQERAGRLHRK